MKIASQKALSLMFYLPYYDFFLFFLSVYNSKEGIGGYLALWNRSTRARAARFKSDPTGG